MTAHELDHLAIAVPRWTDARAYLGDELGGRWLAGFHTPAFSPALVGFDADMRIELLEPGKEPESFVRRFINERGGAAPHHVTFKVADIEASIEASLGQGISPILIRTDNDQWREAFLHPKDTGLGFLVQMVEASFDPAMGGEQIGTVKPLWAEPPERPPALPALTGIVHDWGDPVTVLVNILGAEAEELSNTIRRFRWAEGADLILRRDPSVPATGIEAVVIGGAARQDVGVAELEGARIVEVPELGTTFAALSSRLSG